MPETLPAAEPRPEAESADLAVLRDRLARHVHGLSEIELRDLVDRLGLAREGEPAVIRYPGGRMKLSTDPEEMPPYGPPVSDEEWHAQIEAGLAAVDRGEVVPAEEVMAELRAKVGG